MIPFSVEWEQKLWNLRDDPDGKQVWIWCGAWGMTQTGGRCEYGCPLNPSLDIPSTLPSIRFSPHPSETSTPAPALRIIQVHTSFTPSQAFLDKGPKSTHPPHPLRHSSTKSPSP